MTYFTKYNIQSVICHQGSLHSGHYTMNSRNEGGSWLCFDDARTYKTAAPPSNGYIILLTKADETGRREKVWRH